MDYKKELLLKSAARLYSLGVDLEMARDELKRLAENGVSYGSDEMKKAYDAVCELDRQWKALEKEYLGLRAEILQENEE